MIGEHPNTVGPLESVSLVDPAFWRRDDRDQVFARFRREAPVWWHPETANVHGFWSVTRYSEVESISRDWKTFCSGLGASIADESVELTRLLGGMLNMDAPEHVRLRRIVNRAFSPKAMREGCWRPSTRAHARQWARWRREASATSRPTLRNLFQ